LLFWSAVCPGILQARAIGERIITKMKEFVDIYANGMG